VFTAPFGRPVLPLVYATVNIEVVLSCLGGSAGCCWPNLQICDQSIRFGPVEPATSLEFSASFDNASICTTYFTVSHSPMTCRTFSVETMSNRTEMQRRMYVRLAGDPQSILWHPLERVSKYIVDWLNLEARSRLERTDALCGVSLFAYLEWLGVEWKSIHASYIPYQQGTTQFYSWNTTRQMQSAVRHNT
jgi:hypothetical protein